MPKKYKRKVKDLDETSDNMELLDDYLTQLSLLIQSIDWQTLFQDYPDPGGNVPPPNVPKWPP
jgi:hypothetical protein